MKVKWFDDSEFQSVLLLRWEISESVQLKRKKNRKGERQKGNLVMFWKIKRKEWTWNIKLRKSKRERVSGKYSKKNIQRPKLWATSKKVKAGEETLDSSVLSPFQWQASGGKSLFEARPSGWRTKPCQQSVIVGGLDG